MLHADTDKGCRAPRARICGWLKATHPSQLAFAVPGWFTRPSDNMLPFCAGNRIILCLFHGRDFTNALEFLTAFHRAGYLRVHAQGPLQFCRWVRSRPTTTSVCVKVFKGSEKSVLVFAREEL